MGAAPDISVVVAAHDRVVRLARLLAALEGQTLGIDRFEVVVVDDGSGDATPDLLADARATGSLRLRVLRQEPAAGPAAARNRGWRAAAAPVIAFTDDDCRPEPGWLEALLEARAGREDRIVQGATMPDPDELHTLGPFSRTLELTTQSPHFETCNIAYPRALLERLGGFDEDFPAPTGEDTDLGVRASGGGASAVFAPGAVVYHAVHQLGPLETLRFATRATEDLRTYKLNPELRSLLVQRVFYRRSHALLLEAALAAMIARRAPVAAVFALPYALNVAGRTRARGGSAAHVPFFVLQDAIEVAATVRGAIRHRVPIV